MASAPAASRPGRRGWSPGVGRRWPMRSRARGARGATRARSSGGACWLAGAALALAAGVLRRRAARRRRGRARRPVRGVARAGARAASATGRAVEDGAAEIAIALADALAGGHSLRGAVGAAARGLVGPPGRELRRVHAELELGARTEDALEAMRARVRGHGIDTVVAAACSSATPAATSPGCCATARGRRRTRRGSAREARAATAQARFTGLLVVLLPLGGALLAELASPGFLARAGRLVPDRVARRAWRSCCRRVAAVLIRRLGRVRA